MKVTTFLATDGTPMKQRLERRHACGVGAKFSSIHSELGVQLESETPNPELPPEGQRLRACLKTRKGAVFGPRAGWRGATKENIPRGSSTEEQRSQAACGEKTLRAAALLPVGFVGSVLTARCGDARTSPPRPQPKSLAAAPFPIFSQALWDAPVSRGSRSET